MRILPASALAILLATTPLRGSEPKRTDARNNGFVGPIHSVSTQEGTPLFNLDQGDSPVFLGHSGCQECEFDRSGAMIKSGAKVEGEFRGETFRFVRDEADHITEQLRMDSHGEIVGRDLFGPYGIKEHSEFHEGRRTYHSVWSYDSNGHLLETVAYDPDNQVLSRTVRLADRSGNVKEDWSYSKNDEFSYHIVDTYDPTRDIWTWTSLNENGSLKVAIATQDGRVLSYQHPTTEKNVFGEHFFLDRIGKTQHTFRGHADGTCDDVTTIFPNETAHLPSRVEWRDGSGALRLAADYEYEIDDYSNWTRRSIWVWTPEISERKLYETGTRTLTYWY